MFPALSLTAALLAGMAAAFMLIGNSATQTAGLCENGTAVSSPADNAELVADCEALLALKDELRGTAALNWSVERVITSWDGITVNRGFVLHGAPLRVAKLVLRDKRLNGVLPTSLGQLTGLYELDLRGNQLTGPIPSEWGKLTKMLYLYLLDNELSGSIPPELGMLANLRQLALSDNQLSGSIPPGLGGLSRLRLLSLDDNQLTGRIPSQLGQLSALTDIGLSGNQLTGCLPPALRSVATNDYAELGLTDCPATATLTLTAGTNGSTTPAAGTHSYVYGASVTVTATPDAGYRIASWTGACEGAGAESTCTLVMDLNLTAGVTFERNQQMLTTWSGANGSLSPSAGEHLRDHGSSVTVTATPDTGYKVEAWGGDCIDSGTSLTCMLTMDTAKTARVVFAPSGTVCATATDPSCISAVYLGDPDDYASLADIPGEKQVAPNAAGQYIVRRGEQVTVMTRATVPTGYTRFYLQRSPQGKPYAAVAERLIPPIGTTYTFTISTDQAAATQVTYKLTAARPRPLPRPGHKPELGDVVVTTVFQVPTCSSGTAVSDPAANPGLVSDCVALLELRDALRGNAVLNWSAARAMSTWDGITLSGTPPRATTIGLAMRGLDGRLPPELGRLSNLQSLRLNQNSLSGEIPPELQQLERLDTLHLADNQLTGCVPYWLNRIANHDLDRLNVPECALELAEPEVEIASVPLSASDQTAMINDKLDSAKARRDALRALLPTEDPQRASTSAASEDTAALLEAIAEIERDIARLEAVDTSCLEDSHVEVEYTTSRLQYRGDGVAFSTFTYEDEEPKDNCPVGLKLRLKDPTQIVLWGQATWQRTQDAFGMHARFGHTDGGRELYHWESDGGIGDIWDSGQYIAMRNAAKSGDWYWVKSTGRQAPRTAAHYSDRRHFRYFASDNNRRSVASMGPDTGDFGYWVVIAAHLDEGTLGHSHPPDSWDMGERHVMDSMRTPAFAETVYLEGIPTGGDQIYLSWVEHVRTQSFGNKYALVPQKGCKQLNRPPPQCIAHDGDGYIVKMGTFATGDPESLPEPNRPRVTAVDDTIRVSLTLPSEALWFDVYFKEKYFELLFDYDAYYEDYIGYDDLYVKPDNIGGVAIVEGLRYGVEYSVKVRMYNRRAMSAHSETVDVTLPAPFCGATSERQSRQRNADASTCRPRPPTGLRVSGLTATSGTLHWTEPHTRLSFDVRALEGWDADCAAGLNDQTVLPNTAGNSYSFETLGQATDYRFCVRSVRTTGTGDTQVTRRSTWAQTDESTPPALPENVRVTAKAETSLTLSWDTVERDGLSYEVRRDGGAAVSAESAGSHQFTTLIADREYRLGVQAKRGAKVSGWREVRDTTLSESCPSPRPERPAPLTRTEELSASYKWVERGTTAHEQVTKTLRDDERPYDVWQDYPQCVWQLAASWVLGTPYTVGPTDTGKIQEKPAEEETEPAGTRKVWKVGESEACEQLQQLERKRTRTVTFSMASGYTAGPWSDWGEPYVVSSAPTGVCKTKPADDTRKLKDKSGEPYWTVSGMTACEYQNYEVQPQTNTAVWSGAAWVFEDSGWVNDGPATIVKERTTTACKTKPADETRKLKDKSGEPYWTVSGMTACEYQNYEVQPQTNTAVWSGAAWVFEDTGWVNDGPATIVRERTTTACKAKPADDVIHVAQYQSQSQTRWVAIDDGIFCLEEEEKRYRYKGAYFLRPHVWSDSEEAWVDGTQNASPFFVDPVFGDWTNWSRTGNTRPCAASSDERAESDQASDAIKPARLTTGDYRLQWGEHWLRFTVPEGTFVTLRSRTLDSGVHAAVFEVAGGAELVVDPGQLSRTEPPPSSLTRDVSDPTLTALAASLRLSPEQAADEPTSPERECRELFGNLNTVATVDLGTSGCAVARDGGRFTVSLAGAQLSVSLPSGRDWLLAVSGAADSTPALALVEMESGGYVLLSIVTGAELSRLVPSTSTGLDAVLDAISAAPVASDGG